MKYDSIACEFYLNGGWVDLNAYRLQAAVSLVRWESEARTQLTESLQPDN